MIKWKVKPWYRIPEDDEDDDNSDITDYLGHYEVRAAYKLKEHVFSVMLRNNLESGFENGSVEVTWSFPLWDYPYLKGYVQYFGGYGESLIDYDNYVNKIGIGIAVTDLVVIDSTASLKVWVLGDFNEKPQVRLRTLAGICMSVPRTYSWLKIRYP